MRSDSYLQKRERQRERERERETDRDRETERQRERVIDNEMSKSLINSLKPYLCGYRKTLNIQQAVMCFIVEWKYTLDKQ